MQTLPQPVKLTMSGPMFRYDRPQAGRYRQFWQFDVEAIGDAGPGDRRRDHRARARASTREAGVDNVELHLNSIGDADCRPAYIAALRRVLPRLRGASCRRSSAHRLEKQPAARARLEGAASWQPLIADAPSIADYLCDACREHFAARPGAPRHAGRAVSTPAPLLVRGLDYYTRTAFEFYRAARRVSSRRWAGEGATTA